MQRAVMYVRVSSDEQVKGMSLDFQKQDCLAYAQKKQITIERVFEEKGESAKFANRPELLSLLGYCRKHKRSIDTLIVWKLDRLSRNQLDYYYLKRSLLDSGVSIHSATEPMDDSGSLAGKVFETFSALQAEIDNSVRGERARRGLEAKLATGIYPWKPPVGYVSERAWREGRKKTRPDACDPVLFPIVQSALREYALGNHTQAELARLLDERGFAQARGKKTHKQIVHRLLYQYIDYYHGLLTNPWTGERAKGQHSPMLSEEEYLKILAVRDGRSTGLAVKRLRFNPLFPLRRFLICADCRRYYTASVSRGKCGGRYAYYHCVTRGCSAYGKGIRKETIEQEFCAFIGRYTLKPEFLDELQRLARLALDDKSEGVRAKIEISDRRLAQLEQKRKRIYEMREDDLYTPEEFLVRRREVEKEMAAIALEKRESIVQESEISEILLYVKEFVLEFGQKWSLMDEATCREFQKSVFPAGISYRQNQGFGTPEIGPIYRLFGEFRDSKSPDAGWRGLSWNSLLVELRQMARIGKRLKGREENADNR